MDLIHDLLRQARDLGFRVTPERTRHGRWRLDHPVTGQVVRLPRQARARSYANYRALIRRAAKSEVR